MSTGASVAGGRKASKAAAAGTAGEIALGREQLALQREVFEQGREDNAPWREIGAKALKELDAGMADGAFGMDGFDFKTDPGYEFRVQEGQKALERSAAARGNLLSGGAIKNALRFGQGVASDEYARAYGRERGERTGRFNRLAGIAGVGQQAVAADQQAGQFLAQGGQGVRAGMGNAIAQGAYRQGEIQQNMYGDLAGAGNQGISNFLLYRQLG